MPTTDFDRGAGAFTQGFGQSFMPAFQMGMDYRLRLARLQYEKGFKEKRLALDQERQAFEMERDKEAQRRLGEDYEKKLETEKLINQYREVLPEQYGKPKKNISAEALKSGKAKFGEAIKKVKREELSRKVLAEGLDPKKLDPRYKEPMTSEQKAKHGLEMERLRTGIAADEALAGQRKAQADRYRIMADNVGRGLGLNAAETNAVRQIVEDIYAEKLFGETTWTFPEGMTYDDVFKQASYDYFPNKIPKGKVSVGEPRVIVGMNKKGEPTVAPRWSEKNTQNAIDQIKGQFKNVQGSPNFNLKQWKEITISLLNQERGQAVKNKIDMQKVIDAINRLQ